MYKHIAVYIPKYFSDKYISSVVGKEYLFQKELYLCAMYHYLLENTVDENTIRRIMQTTLSSVVEEIYLVAEDMFSADTETMDGTEEYQEDFDQFMISLQHDINVLSTCYHGRLYEYLFEENPDTFYFLTMVQFDISYIDSRGYVYIDIDRYDSDHRGVMDDCSL